MAQALTLWNDLGPGCASIPETSNQSLSDAERMNRGAQGGVWGGMAIFQCPPPQGYTSVRRLYIQPE